MNLDFKDMKTKVRVHKEMEIEVPNLFRIGCMYYKIEGIKVLNVDDHDLTDNVLYLSPCIKLGHIDIEINDWMMDKEIVEITEKEFQEAFDRVLNKLRS